MTLWEQLTRKRLRLTPEQEEELDKPQVGGGEFQVVMIGGGGGSDVLYKNTKEQRFAEQVDTYGKIFLVKDDIEKAVLANDKTKEQLQGREPKKVIVVPGKIVNIVG